MAYPLGLSKAEQKLYEQTLGETHEIAVRVNLLDMADRVVGSAKVIDGQVLGDRRRFGVKHGPTKRLSLTAVDPDNALNIDTADPGDGALYADRQVEVIYSVRVPTLGWVEVPVFFGSPTSWQRTGDEVAVVADDSSVLAMGAAWAPLTVPKGTKKTEAIQRILRRRTAATRFHLPQVNTRMHKKTSLHRVTRPAAAADRIAKSMDMQLFRRSNNVWVLRRYPRNPVYTFDAEIVEEVAVQDDMSRFANTVLVKGRNPKGPKKRVRAVVQAPPKHPLSAWKIGEKRPDGTTVPRRIVHKIVNDHIRSKAEALRKGKRVLRDHLMGVSQVTVGVLPWPHLEAGDWVRAKSDGGTIGFRLDTYALPLTVTGEKPMTLGYSLTAPVRKRRIRR